MRVFAFILVLAVTGSVSSAAHAACSWSTLTNGTTANATQVMNNFDCVEPIRSVSGNVGIDVASPSSRLTVRQPGNLTGGSPGTYGFQLFDGTNAALTLGYDGSNAYLQSWANKPLYINNQGNNVILNAVSGNVGIGSTSPGSKLQVNGDVQVLGPVNAVGGASGFYPYDRTNNGKYSALYRTGNITSLWDSDVGNVIGYDNAGYVAAGTSPGGWTGSARFAALSSIRAGSFHNSSGSASGAGVTVRVDNTGTPLMEFYSSTTGVGSITTNGSNTTYQTASDERLKIVSPEQRRYEGAIRELWVGDFIWRVNGLSDFGYRAQQLHPLFPAAVRRPHTPNGTWQVDYGKTAALAMWGVKDLYIKADQQDATIASLKVDLAELRRQVDILRKVAARVDELERERFTRLPGSRKAAMNLVRKQESR